MERYLNILKNHLLFQGISGEDILAVCKCIDTAIVKKEKDEYIMRVGDCTDVMGLIVSGSVLSIQEDLWGHRNIINKLGIGSCFAEPFAAVPGTRLNVSIVANEPCEIILLNIQKMMTTCPTICKRHEILIHNLVTELSRKMLILNDKITHVSRRSTRDKIISYLSSEARRQGKYAFTIPFDRQQLADFLCVERAAMSVELSKLQKEGLIHTNRNYFELFTDIDEE